MHFTGNKLSTRFLEMNILNLGYGQFDGDGKYGFPMLRPVSVPNIDKIPLQGFNFALKDKNPETKGVHFFLHDYQFERVWNYPDRYLPVLDKFAYVLSPDFSPYSDMPPAAKIWNVYRNRWCGRYWQEHGITVIPTVTWSDDSTLAYALDGIPKHSVIAISTMGEGRWAKWESLKSHWDEVMNRLEPETVLLYGKDLREQLSGNIVFKKLVSTKVAV